MPFLGTGNTPFPGRDHTTFFGNARSTSRPHGTLGKNPKLWNDSTEIPLFRVKLNDHILKVQQVVSEDLLKNGLELESRVAHRHRPNRYGILQSQ